METHCPIYAAKGNTTVLQPLYQSFLLVLLGSGHCVKSVIGGLAKTKSAVYRHAGISHTKNFGLGRVSGVGDSFHKRFCTDWLARVLSDAIFSAGDICTGSVCGC